MVTSSARTVRAPGPGPDSPDRPELSVLGGRRREGGSLGGGGHETQQFVVGLQGPGTGLADRAKQVGPLRQRRTGRSLGVGLRGRGRGQRLGGGRGLVPGGGEGGRGPLVRRVLSEAHGLVGLP